MLNICFVIEQTYASMHPMNLDLYLVDSDENCQYVSHIDWSCIKLSKNFSWLKQVSETEVMMRFAIGMFVKYHLNFV